MEPKCPKCGSREFEAKRVRNSPDPGLPDIYIVYCSKCGHIVGCAGPEVGLA